MASAQSSSGSIDRALEHSYSPCRIPSLMDLDGPNPFCPVSEAHSSNPIVVALHNAFSAGKISNSGLVGEYFDSFHIDASVTHSKKMPTQQWLILMPILLLRLAVNDVNLLLVQETWDIDDSVCETKHHRIQYRLCLVYTQACIMVRENINVIFFPRYSDRDTVTIAIELNQKAIQIATSYLAHHYGSLKNTLADWQQVCNYVGFRQLSKSSSIPTMQNGEVPVSTNVLSASLTLLLVYINITSQSG